ncbi:MAG: formylglycine-generating enzyme family protein, partial [Pseudomonadota bacterium]
MPGDALHRPHRRQLGDLEVGEAQGAGEPLQKSECHFGMGQQQFPEGLGLDLGRPADGRGDDAGGTAAAIEGGEFAEAEKHWRGAAEMFDTRRTIVQGRSYLQEAQARYRQAMNRIDRQRVMKYRTKAFKKVLDAADEAERLGQRQAYQKAIEAYHKATADLLTAAAEADARWQREHAGDIDRQVTTLLVGARRALEKNEFDEVRRLLAEVDKLRPDHPEVDKLEARLAALDLPGTLRLDLGDGVHIDCVLIPKGTFRMGSAQDEAGRSDNERRHEVTLGRAFYMSVAEVSQDQYRAVLGN